ncbi:IS3 family transposase [Prevotella histicola]
MTTKKNSSVNPNQSSSASLLKDIRRNTKRIFTSEQKVLIVMEGIRGEHSIAELCRKYGISDSTYYKWNKDFIEAGKARLDGDTIREATSDEVKELRQENIRLKEALADLVVRYDVGKKKLETHRISPMHESYIRYSAEEKESIILTIKRSELSIVQALKRLGIPRRTFYNWYKKYAIGGLNALRATHCRAPTTWNRIPDNIRQIVVELSLEYHKLTPRELSVLLLEESQIFVSESSFYRILYERGLLERMEHDFIFAADEFHHKTKFANEMWQTDFTYFKVKGWGWYYLSTVIDDYSRYIIHWELCSSMTSDDVSRTIDKAIEKAGVTFQNPPCLLSDNGPCYIASSLKQYLCKEYNIKHIHGKPLHPQTQGKIERYHRSMKNVIKLNHYFCPSELENAIDGWVKYYNERRFHESLDNLTPRDVYLGQGEKIKKIREIIKQNSIKKRIFDNKTMKYQSK